MNNYEGSVELAAGLKQKNDGDFPLLNTEQIQAKEDGTRLDAYLETLSAGDEFDNADTLKKFKESEDQTRISFGSEGSEKELAYADEVADKAKYSDKSISVGSANGYDIKDYSIAFGDNTIADAAGAVAIGNGATARGGNAIALGQYAKANYHNSVAIGNGAKTGSVAKEAVAIGTGTNASENGQTVIGIYSKEESSYPYSTVIGAGTSSSDRKNAVVISYGDGVEVRNPNLKITNDGQLTTKKFTDATYQPKSDVLSKFTETEEDGLLFDGNKIGGGIDESNIRLAEGETYSDTTKVTSKQYVDDLVETKQDKVVEISKTEYDALEEKKADTIYIVDTPDEEAGYPSAELIKSVIADDDTVAKKSDIVGCPTVATYTVKKGETITINGKTNMNLVTASGNNYAQLTAYVTHSWSKIVSIDVIFSSAMVITSADDGHNFNITNNGNGAVYVKVYSF